MADHLSVTQIYDDRLRASGPGGMLSYRYGGLPKPCVHPLVTPAGHTISGFEMSDHVWHRGLWFTIKFVDGANYWEENAPSARNVSRPSRRRTCWTTAPFA